MKQVRLGRTGIHVAQVGFGGIPVQTVSREQAMDTVRYAYRQGINFFDTAQAYTVSESIIGEALEPYRGDIYYATKSSGRNVETVSRHLDASLDALRTDYIDIYQLHNVVGEEALDGLLAPGGVYDFLMEKKEQGVIRNIGITSHRLGTIMTALMTDRFSTIQFPFNYIENEAAADLFPRARAMDVGIIVMKPMAGGAMTHPAASIRWLLSQTTDVVIPGMERRNLVDENIAAAASGPPSREDIDALSALADELGPVFCRRCGYCLPCPNDIPVNFIASAELFFNRSGWHKLDAKHVEGFRKGLMCTACGECETRCPYNLPLTRLVPAHSARLMDHARRLGAVADRN